jgi:biopolymer transport protein ExbB
MKHIAFSALLSLACLSQSYSEEIDHSSTTAAPVLSEADMDALEVDPSELEKELLALEQELLNDNDEAIETQILSDPVAEWQDPSVQQAELPSMQLETEPSVSSQQAVSSATQEETSAIQEVFIEEQPEQAILEDISSNVTEADLQENETMLSEQLPAEQTAVQEELELDLSEESALASPVLENNSPSSDQTTHPDFEQTQQLVPALVPIHSDTEFSDHDSPTIAPISTANESEESMLLLNEEEEADLEKTEETAPSGIEEETSAILFTNDAAGSEEPLIPAISTQPKGQIEISLQQVYAGSPFIYSFLLAMSFASIAIWFYSMIRMKSQASISETFYRNLRNKLMSNHFDDALSLCEENRSIFSRILSSGLAYRKYGIQTMLENMKAEGKRATISSWQRLGLLQDIAIIAPMLGLLGTVLGMFYAFYDLNRSFESIANLFDGLGISVGTTVAGIMVAIIAMILHSVAKFRLVKSLARIENEAVSLAHLMDEKN